MAFSTPFSLRRIGKIELGLAAVTNIQIKTSAADVSFTWTDPIDGEELSSQWKQTVIVTNDNHIPTSIDDGVILYTSSVRNQHQTEPYVSKGLIDGKDVYYGIFPCSQEDKYNYNLSQTGKIDKYVIDTGIPDRLEDCSFDQLVELANKGESVKEPEGAYWEYGGKQYRVGDEANIEVNGKKRKFKLVGLLKDRVSDGRKVPFSFISIESLGENAVNTNIDDCLDFNSSPLKQIIDKLTVPEQVVPVIKERHTLRDYTPTVEESEEKIWIPATQELYPGDDSQPPLLNTEPYIYYTENENRILKVNNEPKAYWTRNINTDEVFGGYMRIVSTSGTIESSAANNYLETVIGLCIGDPREVE